MKPKMKRFFTLSANDADYFNGEQNKIELVSCKANGHRCKSHLQIINESWSESIRLRRDKDYAKSVDILKRAYYATFDLNQDTCVKCAELFRTIIFESIEGTYKELDRLSKGFFKKKHFQTSHKIVGDILEELKNVKKSDVGVEKEAQKHYLNEYLKRQVG
ncbi:MAG: hypothetical protein R2757_16200 [Draconibacterium sp.]